MYVIYCCWRTVPWNTGILDGLMDCWHPAWYGDRMVGLLVVGLLLRLIGTTGSSLPLNRPQGLGLLRGSIWRIPGPPGKMSRTGERGWWDPVTAKNKIKEKTNPFVATCNPRGSRQRIDIQLINAGKIKPGRCWIGGRRTVTVASLADGDVEAVTIDDALLRDLIVEGRIIFDTMKKIFIITG